MIIEPQPNGYPWVAKTGKGDGRTTAPLAEVKFADTVRGNIPVDAVIVEKETYDLLIDFVNNAEATQHSD